MKTNQAFLSNTVPAGNQTRQTFKIVQNPAASKRILFLGNSITLHEIKPSIGWHNNWGMAASAEENDFVHIVLNSLKEKYGEISYCIANVSKWERNYWNTDILEQFKEAKNYADIVIIRLGENVQPASLKEYPLLEYARKFVKYFTVNSEKVVITDLFWEHTAICNVFKKIASENGFDFVKISDLGYQNENKALGLFDNPAVSAHPSDLGMKMIAERILEKFSIDVKY